MWNQIAQEPAKCWVLIEVSRREGVGRITAPHLDSTIFDDAGPARALPVNPNERKYRARSGISASGHEETSDGTLCPGKKVALVKLIRPHRSIQFRYFQ